MGQCHKTPRRLAFTLVGAAMSILTTGCPPTPDDIDLPAPVLDVSGDELSPIPSSRTPSSSTTAEPDLPDPNMFSSGSSSFWLGLDNQAVGRFSAANQRRLMATRVKDTAAANAAQQEYDRYFSLHREYHAKYIQAETIERATALGVKIGTSIRP